MTAPKLKTRDGSDLYDRDFYAWTQDQAARLRRLSADQGVDVAHLAEEIEDLGKRDLRELESHLEQCLAHLLKLALSPAQQPRRHWFDEAERARINGIRVIEQSPGLRQLLDVEKLWGRARRLANRDLRKFDEPEAPSDLSCPLSLDALLSEESDLTDAQTRIRQTLP
jgi:hypothetical protein